MIFLQNNNNFDEIAEYDTETGNYYLHLKSTLKSKQPIKTNGFYAFLSDMFFALYVDKGELKLRFTKSIIILSDNIKIEISGKPESRNLQIIEDRNILFEHKYSIDIPNNFQDDPTPFVEDEDFDFGLFIANISKDKIRKKVLLGDE
ncbi:MAG: hypothetical protein JXA50_03285 [Deltaproteobacteria bacterium]|nr:hypothetical protein [Deltaproteobacteria bacterium]